VTAAKRLKLSGEGSKECTSLVGPIRVSYRRKFDDRICAEIWTSGLPLPKATEAADESDAPFTQVTQFWWRKRAAVFD